MPTVFAALSCRQSRTATTVLVLDASAAVGLAIIRALRRYGVDAILATSGAQALTLCRQHKVGAVVFHDDALGARHHLATLQRSHARLPVAIVGSDCDAAGPSSQERIEARRTAFFSKPLEMSGLLDQLNHWIRPAERETDDAVGAPSQAEQLGPEFGTAPTRGNLPKLGGTPTRRMGAVDEPRAATPPTIKIAAARSRPTGSYSIVNRKRDTLQFAAV